MLKRYSKAFWLLNASTFLFFFSFNLILPELPEYLENLGGADYKGYIVGVFTLMAAFSRPVSGKLADVVGRLPVMYVGGFVCVIAAIFYPLFATVFAFLFIRAFHGFSTGFLPTGAMAYMADIIPDKHRGEAMGIAGIMNNLGFMAAIGISSPIKNQLGMTNLFYFSGIIAAFALALLIRLPETLKDKQRFSFKNGFPRYNEIYDHRAWGPVVVMFLTALSFGALLTVIPDYSIALGIGNKGTFFVFSTVATILVRMFAGKLSDRIGRIRTTILGTSLWIVTTGFLIFQTETMFMLGAIFMGLSLGVNSPTLFAWAVDVADGVKAGRVMGTLFLGMELGIACGSFCSGAIYQNNIGNLSQVFTLLTIANVTALVFLYFRKLKEDRLLRPNL